MQQMVSEMVIATFTLRFRRIETRASCMDDIVAHFRREIEAHPIARFIGVFDHFEHTCALGEGEIAEGIRDARNVVFCFGTSIPGPLALATRPRSIGICELDDEFVITFLEPPMPLANAAVERWAHALVAAPIPA